MRKAAFLISVIAVSWTSATVDGQTTPYGEIGSAAASQTLFQTSLAPAAAYGAFRRDELMRFAASARACTAAADRSEHGWIH
jgi:hypothetical protein